MMLRLACILLVVVESQAFISLPGLRDLVRAGLGPHLGGTRSRPDPAGGSLDPGRDDRRIQFEGKNSSVEEGRHETVEQSNKRNNEDLSLRQIIEFKQLGKFQLNQIRSQLNYGSVLNNYRMNINYQLRKVGLLNPQSRSDNNTVCYEEIGCIEISDRWYGLSRPVNLLPLDRHVINTQFILRTRNNLQERYLRISDPENFALAAFEGGKPVKLIIHGFIDTGTEDWVKEMSEALLEAEDCNVISVDWGGGSLPLYTQAASNTRVVGLEVAYFVNSLIAKYGVDAEDVHIIGHSLGAHIAGYAGERIQNLGRITGLDPAEPLFQDMPEFVRLDPSDADFVDVIHTDAKSIMLGGYGMKQAVGHLDFYPNGGGDQPGCSLLAPLIFSALTVEDLTLPSPDSVSRHLVACAHNRAIELFTDSIKRRSSCPMIGHQCSSFEEYKNGGCLKCGKSGDRCSVLGYYAKKPKDWMSGETRTLYLETGPVSPFCQHNYVVEFNLGTNEESEEWVQGHVNLNLYGDKGELIKHKITPKDVSEKFTRGDKKVFKLSLSRNIGLVSIAEVYWKYDHEIDPFDLSKMCLVFCSDSLYLQSLAITSFITDKQRNVGSHREVLCGETDSAVKSGDWKLFYKKCPPPSPSAPSDPTSEVKLETTQLVI